MAHNAPLGQSITFTAMFFDSAAVLTVPSSATLTVTYPPSSNSLTTVSCDIAMTAVGDFFTATWASSVAALGLSSYAASAPGLVSGSSGSTGTLRIIG
jgi:hypothetical protein